MRDLQILKKSLIFRKKAWDYFFFNFSDLGHEYSNQFPILDFFFLCAE